MDVELMRRLDRVLGDAACSVLATAHRIGKPFSRTRPIKKIVVMKFFGMGSIIVASRSLAALRHQYPNAELHFVTFKSNKGILDILGMTDHNHYVDPSTPQDFVKTTLATAHALRKAQCDLVLDLEFFAKFPLVLGSLAGIPQKAGFYLTSESWRRELLEGWRPYKVRPAPNEPLGHRFETGTLPHELLAGFVACVRYVDSVGFDAIHAHERALGERFLAGLPSACRLHGLPTMDGRVSTFAFTVEGRTPQEVAERLGRRDIAVWYGNYYAVEIMRRLSLDECLVSESDILDGLVMSMRT